MKLKSMLFRINLPWALFLFFTLSIVILNNWFSLEILDPANFMWLFDGDYGHSLEALHLFRYSSWDFPLGTISNANYPIGTNVLAMDGNLLLGLFLKIFNSFLPDMFQPYGIWIFICIFLQFYSIYWAIRQIGCLSSVAAFLGAVLIALLPTFFFRSGHLNLLPHFLIIFTWGVFFSHQLKVETKSYLLVFLTYLSALIHFYFTPGILGISILHFWHCYGYKTDFNSLTKIVVRSAALVSGLLGIMYLSGYFDGFNPNAGGFSNYSMNFNSLVNSMNTSTFIPSFPTGTDGQYEGYQYLGLGLLLFIFCSFLYLKKATFSGIDKQVWYFFLFILIFSLSYKWYFGQYEILDLSKPFIIFLTLLLFSVLCKFDLKKILSFIFIAVCYVLFALVLRSSGRLLWFVVYPVLIIIFCNTTKKINHDHASLGRILWPVVLSVLISFQFVDMLPLLNKHGFQGSSLIDLTKMPEYRLAESLEGHNINGIVFIDAKDYEIKSITRKLVFFMANKKINFAPIEEERSKIKYKELSKETHISKTLEAGGSILTNNCEMYAQNVGTKKIDLVDGWCVRQ